MHRNTAKVGKFESLEAKKLMTADMELRRRIRLRSVNPNWITASAKVKRVLLPQVMTTSDVSASRLEIGYETAVSKFGADRRVYAIRATRTCLSIRLHLVIRQTRRGRANHKSASALGGLTDTKGIAPLVRFLVTEGWWITGQTTFANGGYTTR